MFITAFTRARHPSLSCVRSIPSMSHPTSWIHILILAYHPRLGLPSGPNPSGISTEVQYAPLLSPIRVTYITHLILLNLINQTIFGEVYSSLSSSLRSLLHSPVTSHLWTRIPSPAPYSRTPSQPMFHPQCKRPSFTRIQNNRQNYSPVYLKLHIFGQQTAE